MERRAYKRECIKLESGFIRKEAENPNERELFGCIYDISEVGMKIIISDEKNREIANEILEGDIICFQTVDVYELYYKEWTEVISGEVTVLRKEAREEEIVFGCKFNSISDNLKQYIENKRVAAYIDAGYTLT